MKKIPIRTCIGCGSERPKQELLRIVRTAGGEIFMDPGGKSNGRGAYICKNPECLQRAWKTKGLDRSFREAVSRAVYERLEKEMTAYADRV